MNLHGLKRDIPEDVKRQVRQRCGFGCIICGSAIYQYDHFSPPYKDAKTHNPDGITLLCGGCHDKKTRNFLSLQTIINCNSSPQALRNGFSWGVFDIDNIPPKIVLGTFSTQNTNIILQVFSDPILRIDLPQSKNSPFLLSAILKDRDGNIMIEIDKNEWKTYAVNWDCEINRNKIIIRSQPKNIELCLRSEPPNTIIVEKLIIQHKGANITCQKDQNLTILLGNGTVWETYDFYCEGCRIGIDIAEDGIYYGRQ